MRLRDKDRTTYEGRAYRAGVCSLKRVEGPHDFFFRAGLRLERVEGPHGHLPRWRRVPRDLRYQGLRSDLGVGRILTRQPDDIGRCGGRPREFADKSNQAGERPARTMEPPEHGIIESSVRAPCPDSSTFLKRKWGIVTDIGRFLQ